MAKKGGIQLTASTIVVIIIVFVVLVMALFFFKKGVSPMGPIISESELQKDCSQWRAYGYSYSKFNDTNYPSLVAKFGSPVKAKYYCTTLKADILVEECGDEKCIGDKPSGWVCCCEDLDPEETCESTNCGWGKFC